MLLDKTQPSSDYDVEFLLERPIGWSSACFDSTINYYLNYNASYSEFSNEENNTELEEKDF
jgi:hypothetical protein